MQNKKTNKTFDQKRVSRAVFFLFLLGLFTLGTFRAGDFFAQIIGPYNLTYHAAPYDGTVLPIREVPNWTSLSAEELGLNYEQIPQQKMMLLSSYDPEVLKTPTENLDWKSEQDLITRNSKSTYLVPYMGNYKFDGLENVGGHLGVDIRAPKNTPVYAIGNGVVRKVAEQTSGFGKHIVLEHRNFPSWRDEVGTSGSYEMSSGNPLELVTLYSSYSHLNEILVHDGEVVKKGQLIARSGQSGNATIPHLHFQIDNDQAPWHPYWHFSSEEMHGARLTYAEAINQGFAKEKALAATIHPMLYVQKYLGDVLHHSAVEPSSQNLSLKSVQNWQNDLQTAGPDMRPFIDIDFSAKIAPVLLFLKQRGIVEGYDDGSFRPRTLVSRAEAVKLVLKTAGIEVVPNQYAPFHDVASDDWYRDEVATAYDQHIAEGYSDMTFRPWKTVMGAEFLKMLFTAFQIQFEVNDLSETSSTWFEPYVQYAQANHLIVIEDFKPYEPLSREAVANILYRMLLFQKAEE